MNDGSDDLRLHFYGLWEFAEGMFWAGSGKRGARTGGDCEWAGIWRGETEKAPREAGPAADDACESGYFGSSFFASRAPAGAFAFRSVRTSWVMSGSPLANMNVGTEVVSAAVFTTRL